MPVLGMATDRRAALFMGFPDLKDKNARMGFPGRIQGTPIMELLLEKCDQYPDAGERRLFYVALTRAK